VTRTVRDASFDVLRLHGLTTVFANPSAVAEVAGLLAEATAPVLVVGAGADSTGIWAGLTTLA
jgi:thiamine pyrophosphate-dependent acetolactate synthase large subunit-like protein